MQSFIQSNHRVSSRQTRSLLITLPIPSPAEPQQKECQPLYPPFPFHHYSPHLLQHFAPVIPFQLPSIRTTSPSLNSFSETPPPQIPYHSALPHSPLTYPPNSPHSPLSHPRNRLRAKMSRTLRNGVEAGHGALHPPIETPSCLHHLLRHASPKQLGNPRRRNDAKIQGES